MKSLPQAERYRRRLHEAHVGAKWDPIEDILVEGEAVNATDADGRVWPAFIGIITNQGKHTFQYIEVVVFGLNRRGQAVFAATYAPVDDRFNILTPFGATNYVDPYRDSDWPLGPGVQRYFQVLLPRPPKSWTRTADVDVVDFTLND